MKSNHRQSHRLRYYNYSREGIYFVTICTRDRQCLFGEISEVTMKLSEMGKIAEKCWNDIPKHFPHMVLDDYIVMPNHIHGIIIINQSLKKGECYSPLQLRGTSKTIGSAIRGFKIGVTQWARKNTTLNDVWQRNYYEHVVRNDLSFYQIKEYILHNPEKWSQDKLHPSNIQKFKS